MTRRTGSTDRCTGTAPRNRVFGPLAAVVLVVLVGFDLARVERHPVAEDDEIVDEVVEVAGALESVNAGDPEGRHRFPLVAPAAGEHATAGTTTRAGGPRPGGRLGGLLHGNRAQPSLRMSDSEASRRTGARPDAGGGGFASSRRRPIPPHAGYTRTRINRAFNLFLSGPLLDT